MAIDLESIGKQVDELLANETPESMSSWLQKRRNNHIYNNPLKDITFHDLCLAAVEVTKDTDLSVIIISSTEFHITGFDTGYGSPGDNICRVKDNGAGECLVISATGDYNYDTYENHLKGIKRNV